MATKRKQVWLYERKDFKTVPREKDLHHIKIKGSIQQEDITVINVYVPHVRTSTYIKQIWTDLKVKFHNNTIKVGDLK